MHTVPTVVFELEQFLPYRLSELAERVSRALAATYSEEFGSSVAEWRVLATLATQDALRASEISGRTNLDKVRVSRAVARLRQRDLLEAQRSSRDQRARNLSLTAAGRSLFEQIAPRVLAWEAQVLESLSTGEREALGRSLSLLAQRLDALEDAAVQNMTEDNTTRICSAAAEQRPPAEHRASNA